MKNDIDIKESKDLMERMGLLPQKITLRKNIFEHNETLEEILEEGVFMSHDAEKIYDILNKHFKIIRIDQGRQVPSENEIGIEFDAYKDTNHSYGTNEVSVISIVIHKSNKSIENIKKFFELCGWVNSETIEYEKDSDFLVCTFEKRREEDALPLPKYLYHITPENKLNKILKIGLTPRSENKIGEHPERIYFFITKDLVMNYKSYADSFWKSKHGDTKRKEKYVLLKIDTKKCRSDFKIYGDPNMVRGVWSFDNIPAEAITVEERNI